MSREVQPHSWFRDVEQYIPTRVRLLQPAVSVQGIEKAVIVLIRQVAAALARLVVFAATVFCSSLWSSLNSGMCCQFSINPHKERSCDPRC